MKIKLDGTLLDPPEDGDKGLTLGEQSLIKRQYGFVPGKDEFDLRDPDHLRAFLFMCLRKKLPDAPANMISSQIDNARVIDFVNDDGSELSDSDAAEQQQLEMDPTPPLSEGESVPVSDSSEAG